MAKPPKKQRLSVYLEPDVMKALAAHAARRDQSLSLIAEAGIASFLSPDAAERQEAATTKRLDQLDRRMARMERDLGIAVETLAVFIRFWLTTSPPRQRRAPKPANATKRSSPRSAGDSLTGRSLGRKFPRTSRPRTTRINHGHVHFKYSGVPPFPCICTLQYDDHIMVVVRP